MSEEKLSLLKKAVEDAQTNLEYAKSLLSQLGVDDLSEIKGRASEVGKVEVSGNNKIIEGVFDGQNMIGPENKAYSVPPNYASKSKLVEGDSLKLTIMPDGAFVYKQIGPIDRARLVGTLVKEGDNWKALAKGKSYKIISASVSYFKGEPGDEVIILLPKQKPSRFAAVENIVKSLTPEQKEELLLSGDDMELPLGEV